jgi:2'-5' RNA ligase
MRLFIAVDLPEALRRVLGQAQVALREAAPTTDVRWTSPERLHITLRFLGEVPEDAVPLLVGVMKRAAAGCPPPELAAAGVGAFPSLSRPRGIWVGIDGPLAGLAAEIGTGLTAAGYPPEPRAFRAHVTLGRVRRSGAPRALATAIDVLGRARFGAWTATEVVLYRSHLRPTGSVYEPLARVPLLAPCP